VTAIGASALEAETLSKLALLSGADGARDAMAEHGGVIVHDSGEVEAVGSFDGRLFEAPSVAAPAGASR
jgi:hypothetical protein